MSKLVVTNLISLEGFFEGVNHDLSWHNVDEEFNDFAIANLHSIGILLFGRVTYQLMASYWPTEQGIKDDPIVAGLMNNMPKIVFSKTLNNADWNNTKLVKENIIEEISNLKQTETKDLNIFGSGVLTSYLLNVCLIDELRIMISPVLLGNGSPLFNNIKAKHNLTFLNSKSFKNGNVLLYYEVSN